jgi:anti-sigma B factor antagonist
MDGALDIAIRTERGVVIAAVTGEIDISTVAQLRERLYELADHGGTLIVDLNRVTFIDSAGLGALVGMAQRAAEHGGSLHAVCAQPQPRRLLWMTGVDKRIPLWATTAEALMFQEASQRSSDSGLISRRPYRSGSALPGGGLALLRCSANWRQAVRVKRRTWPVRSLVSRTMTRSRTITVIRMLTDPDRLAQAVPSWVV